MPKLRKNTIDNIKALIEEGYTDLEIAEKTGVVRQTVSKYRREADVETPLKTVETEQVDEEWEEFKPHVYRLMRVLGVDTAKEALEKAHAFITKINPYVLYHGLGSPAELVSYFEEKVEETQTRSLKLMKEAEAESSKLMETASSWKTKIETLELQLQDENVLAMRLGVDRWSKVIYRYMIDRGLPEGWGPFINVCIRETMKGRGFRLEESRIGKKTYYIMSPEGEVSRYRFPKE